MRQILLFASALTLLAIPACGSTPASTTETTTTQVQRSGSGAESRRQTTQTTEVAADGSTTTDRTVSTQTTSPASRAQP